MSKLKDINLKDLGVKNITENDFFTSQYSGSARPSNFDKVSKMKFFGNKSERAEDEVYYLKKKNKYPSNMNNKFLKYVNIIENIKDKPGQYLDQRTEREKDLEPEEFTPPPKQPEKTIPLTFRKFFYRTFPKNITEFALKNPEKLPGLISDIRNDIQKDALTWLDFVADKQIGTLLCQIENYSDKGKKYKKLDEFQDIPQVIQWIIDINLKMRYESVDWNKDGAKTFSEEQENLLIINTSLFQRIEIAEQWENNQDKEKRKIPLPLHRVWNQFDSVITFPLKNNFQFIIIDKRALVSWQDFQKLEIKYDETNSTTYFLRKMEGGFKQLTHFNSIAFISE